MNFLDVHLVELIYNKLNIKDKIKFNFSLNKEQKIKCDKEKINKLRLINHICEKNLIIDVNNLTYNFKKFLNDNSKEPDIILFCNLYKIEINPVNFINKYDVFLEDLKNNNLKNDFDMYPNFDEIINNSDEIINNSTSQFITDIYKFINPNSFIFLYNHPKSHNFIKHIFNKDNILFVLINVGNKDIVEFILKNLKIYNFNQNIYSNFYTFFDISIKFKHSRNIIIELFDLLKLNEEDKHKIIEICINNLETKNYFLLYDK